LVTTILIGIDDAEGTEDAVAFGRTLASAAGASVTLAALHRRQPMSPGRAAGAYDPAPYTGTEAALARLALPLDHVVHLSLGARAGKSAAHALREAAVQQGAGMIVVAAGRAGHLGRVLPGTTAERLLHAAPCPVAVVPSGCPTDATAAGLVVGCAYLPTEDGEASLGAAEEFALALRASLTVVQVVEPLSRLYDVGEMPLHLPEMDASIRAGAKRALDQRVARLNSGLECEGTVYAGRPADVLIGLTETVDIMVIGSRGSRAITAVLVGGVSSRVIRSASSPVVVIPHRAASALGTVFASAPTRGQSCQAPPVPVTGSRMGPLGESMSNRQVAPVAPPAPGWPEQLPR
jgi:nucleotide-binding universal stress UspA family protein